MEICRLSFKVKQKFIADFSNSVACMVFSRSFDMQEFGGRVTVFLDNFRVSLVSSII